MLNIDFSFKLFRFDICIFRLYIYICFVYDFEILSIGYLGKTKYRAFDLFTFYHVPTKALFLRLFNKIWSKKYSDKNELNNSLKVPITGTELL